MIEDASRSNLEFGLRKCVASGWAVVRDHWFALALAALLRDLISLLIAGLAFAIFIDWRGWNLVIAIVIGRSAWCVLQSGYLAFCLEACDRNKVSWSTFFSAISSGFQMLVATVSVWLAVGLGLVLLVIPGLFLAVRFCLFGYALVDQKLNAFESLTVSNRMLKGFARFAAAILGTACVSVGLVGWLCGVLEPLVVTSLAVLYRHIRTREVSQ